MRLSLHTLLWIGMVCGLTLRAVAQDAHYTQFGYAPLLISPSLTGVFRGDQRYALMFREQWQSVPVGYRQVTAMYDMRFRNADNHETPWAAGLVLHHDIAGDSRLYTASADGLGSYTQMLGKRQFLSAGLQLGAGHRGFDRADLHFDDQYDGEHNNLPTQEPFERFSKWFMNFSAGLNYRWKDTSRTVIDAGIGFHRLNTPETGFYDNPTYEVSRRYTAYVLATWQLSPRFDVVGHFVYQRQMPYAEFLVSAYGRTHVSFVRGRELSVQFGVGMRSRDAVYPQFAIEYQTWRLGLNYDVNLSAFRVATVNNGGPEISLTYIFRKVPDLQYCPTCPKYM